MKLLEGLNPEQCVAVNHKIGPLLILAGAGSGKTSVLVARTGKLIFDKTTAPERICVLTFTNKAARELKTRLAGKLGGVGGLWAGTFHSFGLQILRRFGKEIGIPGTFAVLDPTDAGAMMKELLKDFHTGEKVAYDAGRLLSLLSRYRESGSIPIGIDEEYAEAVEWVLPKYLAKLQALGCVDFDSLILKPVELLKSKVGDQIRANFDQVMIDEFQDTSEMQMRLVKLLVDGHKNIAVVGDDDQSIYGWRGACIKNILDFPKHFKGCKVIRLERNYRSTEPILALANAIIHKNKDRHTKVLKAEGKGSGALPEMCVYEDENEEVENICLEISHLIGEGFKPSEIAVLYRSNGQGALLEAELRKTQTPYRISGGTGFFDRKETRDVLAYLRSALRPTEISFRRILNTPTRGIGDKTVEGLHGFAIHNKKSFVWAARHWSDAGVEPRAGESLSELFRQLDALIPSLLVSPSPAGTMIQWLDQIGYRRHIEKHAPNASSAHQHWRIVETFTQILDSFVARGGKTEKTISEFLDAMELRDPVEEEEKQEQVQLLTLHACKGLEFPAVILMGLEEDLLPHKTLGSDVAEERRLFYVGVTRAEQKLIMTRAKSRLKYGRRTPAVPSRFLLELPKELFTERFGLRPVRENVRKNLIADLYKKIEQMDLDKTR